MKIRIPFLRKNVITGCESTGTAGVPYMTRYYLLNLPSFQVCIHVFHRSDAAGDYHDHPWSFWTLVLWRGYAEHLLIGDAERARRVWPGQMLLRRAKTMHRVELIDGKSAVTLCIMGKRHREWGFRSVHGLWRNFRQYFAEKGC